MARLRRTALPTRRAATIPTCGGPVVAGARSTVIPPERLATPVRKTAVNRAAGLNETNGLPLSGSELPPALEAAALDHGAPGAGPHTDTESVLPFAASRVGLVRTLHVEVSPIGRSRCDREDNGRGDSTPVPALSASPGTRARSSTDDREIQRSPAKDRIATFPADLGPDFPVGNSSQGRWPLPGKGFSHLHARSVAPYRRISPSCRSSRPVHILAAGRGSSPALPRRSVSGSDGNGERDLDRVSRFLHTLWTGMWTWR